MVELYVIRHGQTDTNKEKRINGNSTDMPLNETGRKQAENLKEVFDISDFDEVISSPLTRAYETAQILTNGTNVKIKKDDRLREADYGSWDGVLEDELFEKYPDVFDSNGYLLPGYVEYAEKAEDYDDVYARIDDLLNELSHMGNKKIALVCHGFISRSLMKVIMNISDVSKIIQPQNCGVSKFIIDENGGRYLVYYSKNTPLNFDK